MFTLQDLQWMKEKISNMQVVGTYGELMEIHHRVNSVMEKIDQLLDDHPEDEEAENKPATKKKQAK